MRKLNPAIEDVDYSGLEADDLADVAAAAIPEAADCNCEVFENGKDVGFGRDRSLLDPPIGDIFGSGPRS